VTPAKPVPGAAADESPTPASLAREPQLVRPVGPAAVSTVREPAQTAARRDPPAAASARREAPAAPSARREPPARDDAPPRPAAVAKAPVAPAATAKSDDASAGAVPGIDDLPADVRRRLPVLTVGGSAYSADPASRMLILNRQVLREGDAVAADVVLERIQLRSAVLRAGDLRYRISF
jgi:general secretion pathway protein B